MCVTGDQDVDFDAILGELCELESQLNTQQTQINTSLSDEGNVRREGPSGPRQDTDTQLTSALSELSGLMGTAASQETNPTSTMPKANNQDSCPAHPANKAAPVPPPKSLDKNANEGIPSPHVNGNRTLAPPNGQIPKYSPTQMENANGDYNDYEEADWKDVAEGLDTDSAFSDTMSLPSSGSHISVTTTSSGSSGGSSGIGSSHASVSTMKNHSSRNNQSRKFWH